MVSHVAARYILHRSEHRPRSSVPGFVLVPKTFFFSSTAPVSSAFGPRPPSNCPTAQACPQKNAQRAKMEASYCSASCDDHTGGSGCRHAMDGTHYFGPQKKLRAVSVAASHLAHTESLETSRAASGEGLVASSFAFWRKISWRRTWFCSRIRPSSSSCSARSRAGPPGGRS